MNLKTIVLFSFSCSLFTVPFNILHASIPLRWTVETSAANPATFDQFAGATYDLEATLQSRGKPLAVSGDPQLFWQTNGMGSAWWSAPASITNLSIGQSVNQTILKATWTPACDVGARVYNCFIGITGSVYNAAFQLRLRPSPGALPNELPLPTPVIDFAKVTVLNPPWSGGGGSGGVDTNAVLDIIHKTVEGSARYTPKYLWVYDCDDTYPEDSAWYYAQPQPYGSCSAVRGGGFLYRNYDWRFDDAAEFVVRVSAGSGRLASIGVANCGTNLTETFVTSGKPSRYYKCLPGRTVDGINENGVVCEVNVVDGEPQWRSGVLTASDIHPLAAVRWALDNGTSAGMVASNLSVRIKFPTGWTQNFHWMVADAAQTWIVENGAAHLVDATSSSRPVMTNFRLYPSRDTTGAGQERHNLLVGGGPITNAWFTRAYSRSTFPPWESEFKDASEMEAAMSAWETHSREQLRGKGLWQTVHCSIYDITNRTLRVAVQEQDDWYTFAVPSAGGVKPEAVREIVTPMLVSATNELANARLPSWLTAESEEPRGKTEMRVFEETLTDEWDIVLPSPMTNDKKLVWNEGFSDEWCLYLKEKTVEDHEKWTLYGHSGLGYNESSERITDGIFGPGGVFSATRIKTVTPSETDKLAHTSATSGLAKFAADGVLEQATPSSTGGADADYRDPMDAKCHEDAFAEWTFTSSNDDVQSKASEIRIEYDVSTSAWKIKQAPTGWFDNNNPMPGSPDDTEVVMADAIRNVLNHGILVSFTATRQRVATDGETFVTPTFVTKEVAAKQDALPYPTNAIPYSAITNQPTIPVISETDPTFSNAVLAVGVDTNVLAAVNGLDTNVVAQIGAFYETFADIGITPTQGGMTLAGLLAALVAAVTWLKKKALVGGLTGGVPDDPKLHDFFRDSNTLLTGTIASETSEKAEKSELPIPLVAKTANFTTESYKRFVVATVPSAGLTLTMHTPTGTDADVFECRFDGTALTADASVSFTGATVTKMEGETDTGVVKAGKVSLMSAFWNGSTWDVNWKVEG